MEPFIAGWRFFYKGGCDLNHKFAATEGLCFQLMNGKLMVPNLPHLLPKECTHPHAVSIGICRTKWSPVVNQFLWQSATQRIGTSMPENSANNLLRSPREWYMTYRKMKPRRKGSSGSK